MFSFFCGVICGALALYLWQAYRKPVAAPNRATATNSVPPVPTGATRTRDDDVPHDGDPPFRFDL